MTDSKQRILMIFEKNRLETFKKWPYTKKTECNATKMAEAGFFWTGNEKEPDSAQCFVCGKQLDGWESTDEPWSEHKRHAAQCPFAVIGKKEDDLTVEELNNLWKIMVQNIVTNKFKNCEKSILRMKQEINTFLLNYKNKGIK